MPEDGKIIPFRPKGQSSMNPPPNEGEDPDERRALQALQALMARPDLAQEIIKRYVTVLQQITLALLQESHSPQMLATLFPHTAQTLAQGFVLGHLVRGMEPPDSDPPA